MMKREIKFRAKLIDEDRWVYGGGMEEIGENTAMLSIDQKGQLVVYQIDSETVGQYTGLKDCNGTEIYEGDIVKWVDKHAELNDDPETWDDKPFIEKTKTGFVEYRDRGFWINNESFGWEGERLWDWDEIEVIGNIHENPELLEK